MSEHTWKINDLHISSGQTQITLVRWSSEAYFLYPNMFCDLPEDLVSLAVNLATFVSTKYVIFS